ncbi:MAG TPA: DUF3160 domain-containing protein [Prolixibacteraceae bacterium]|nr:DUF3160 domain-containing protein [Prolixibacteraceae bacterium]
MKRSPLFLLLVLLAFSSYAQIDFTAYESFKSQNVDLSYRGLEVMYPRPAKSYYKGCDATPGFSAVLFFDSLQSKLKLSADETSLLEQNHFFVSERLSYSNFGNAVHTVYANDLPLYISTDAILHALHCSYSFLLKNIERMVMLGNLEAYLAEMYARFPSFAAPYSSSEEIIESLRDADLYLAVAYSLITEQIHVPRLSSRGQYDEIMQLIESGSPGACSLFCRESRSREIDFSQFKVRGHYVFTNEDKMMGYRSLEPYFRTMMWLGRIEFFLTAPAPNPWEDPWGKDEIRRMNISALLLNKLSSESPKKNLFAQNETIINYLVGESDNVTPKELESYCLARGIDDPRNLLDDVRYDDYYAGLSQESGFEQKIMGGMLFVDPFASAPDTLPVSFRLSGQRFIIDSYALANVVYDRIIYQNQKIHRGLPDPLDALYALGNSDAAFFLEEELEEYHYAPNLANLRYLINQKDASFWESSLYNSWLGAIRCLNPSETEDPLPFFMQTSAWHQQKMNTQLASWSQLRHDNLLYAKPSYTGMTGCSFPYVYVEPYPEFYASLARFAEDAGAFFSTLTSDNWEFYMLQNYFPRFAEIMGKLQGLAQKEIDNVPFSTDEQKWLQSFLFEGGGSGAPPYSGWYNSLFVNDFDIIKDDYPVVDLHTQPTDQLGVPVGYVLHAGTGKVNLGTVMVKTPGLDRYVVYTGPFFSYYETVTEQFLRLTDQDWSDRVTSNTVPARPEWTRAFLAGPDGSVSISPVELPHQRLVTGSRDVQSVTWHLYPNPARNSIFIRGTGYEHLPYTIYSLSGERFGSGITCSQNPIDVSMLRRGLYFIRIGKGTSVSVIKFVKE